MLETAKEFYETFYYVPDAFAKSGGVWLLRLGRNIAKPSYQIELRAINWYNIHFIVEGCAELGYGEKRLTLGKGDAFCIYPGVTYQYGYSPHPDNKTLRMIWISFDGAQSRTLLNKAGFREEAPYVRQVMTKELQHAIEPLFASPGEGYKRQLEQQTSLYRIFGCLTAAEESDLPHAGPSGWVPRSIEYMKTHYMERITVQDVAAYISIHRAYFSKVFTEQVGMAPMRYLEKLKMEKAAELLDTTAYSIGEISLTIGYPDPYTFTHAFTRYYGMPPGKWRKTAAGRRRE